MNIARQSNKYSAHQTEYLIKAYYPLEPTKMGLRHSEKARYTSFPSNKKLNIKENKKNAAPKKKGGFSFDRNFPSRRIQGKTVCQPTNLVPEIIC